MVEASAASSRVEEVSFRDLGDCTSISSPMTMVAGITEAAAAMMMRSPTQACPGVFESSPTSVLQGSPKCIAPSLRFVAWPRQRHSPLVKTSLH